MALITALTLGAAPSGSGGYLPCQPVDNYYIAVVPLVLLPFSVHVEHEYCPLKLIIFETAAFAGRSVEHNNSMHRQSIGPSGVSTTTPAYNIK